MKHGRNWAVVGTLFCVLFLSGCAQTIKVYEHLEKGQDVVTIEIKNNLTKLWVDGKFIDWDRTYDPGAMGYVNVELPTGQYELKWSLKPPGRSWAYKGSGTLYATGKYTNYVIRYAYARPGRSWFRCGFDDYRKKKYSDVPVEAHYTWIEAWGGNIEVGARPRWVP